MAPIAKAAGREPGGGATTVAYVKVMPFPEQQASRTLPCHQGHDSPSRVSPPTSAWITAPLSRCNKNNADPCGCAPFLASNRCLSTPLLAHWMLCRGGAEDAFAFASQSGKGWKDDPRAGVGLKERGQVLPAQHPKSPPRQPPMESTERSAGKGSFPKGKLNPAL